MQRTLKLRGKLIITTMKTNKNWRNRYCVHYSEVHDHDVHIKAHSAKDAARAVAMRNEIPLEENPVVELIKDDVWNIEVTPDNTYQVTGEDVNDSEWFEIDNEGKDVKRWE